MRKGSYFNVFDKVNYQDFDVYHKSEQCIKSIHAADNIGDDTYLKE